jgi:hypothetical protein
MSKWPEPLPEAIAVIAVPVSTSFPGARSDLYLRPWSLSSFVAHKRGSLACPSPVELE